MHSHTHAPASGAVARQEEGEKRKLISINCIKQLNEIFNSKYPDVYFSYTNGL